MTSDSPSTDETAVDGDRTVVRTLDETTVEQIAAGEVITRPARVVGELVDNALDAGASQIDVEVKGDGTDRIRVADDGHGMSREDALRAVQPHTTSKLETADDLRHITTLGFRGEGLASIAEAATLELTTNDGGDVATRVLIDRDEREATDTGRARGTTVEVRDLFADRPARKTTLASPAREFGRIADLLSDYALVRSDVAFRLAHDGNETFATPGTDRTAALMEIYDRETASESTGFDHATTVSESTFEGQVTVTGRLCYPSVTRTDRSHVRLGVNGRPVENESLRRAIVDGYGSLLPDSRFPVAAVEVGLPATAVDPNVHPAKTRVALVGRETITDAVRDAVEGAVTTSDLRRSGETAMDLDSSLAVLHDESAFKDAEVIGQFRKLYLLCEADDDLLVVDQHAAHERINYERLRCALENEPVPSAPLDPPQTVTLDPGAAAAIDAHRDVLQDSGFDVESFGGTTVRVSAVPAPFGHTADPTALQDTIDRLRNGETIDARDDFLADLACHPSLKAGDSLDPAAAGRLLDRLGACEQPYACPHGRPTVLSIEEATLARGFERERTRL